MTSLVRDMITWSPDQHDSMPINGQKRAFAQESACK